MDKSEKIFGVATKALIYDQGKFLFLFKSDTEEVNPNTFDIPGGRLQFGEKPDESLVREVQEETGLSITIKEITETWTFTKGDFQLVGITYLCIPESTEVKLSGEHLNFRWVSPEEMKVSEYPQWLKDSVHKALRFL